MDRPDTLPCSLARAGKNVALTEHKKVQKQEMITNYHDKPKRKTLHTVFNQIFQFLPALTTIKVLEVMAVFSFRILKSISAVPNISLRTGLSSNIA